jgi:hypothetical protein
MRPQVDERHVVLAKAGRLEQLHGEDLAAGAGAEGDALALEIGELEDARRGRCQRLDVRILGARQEGDLLPRHCGGGGRRFRGRGNVGGAAHHRVQALLAGGEVEHLDLEAVLGKEALAIGNDRHAGDRPLILRELHLFDRRRRNSTGDYGGRREHNWHQSHDISPRCHSRAETQGICHGAVTAAGAADADDLQSIRGFSLPRGMPAKEINCLLSEACRRINHKGLVGDANQCISKFLLRVH